MYRVPARWPPVTNSRTALARVTHCSFDTTLPKARGAMSPSIASGRTARVANSTAPAQMAAKLVWTVYTAVSTTMW